MRLLRICFGLLVMFTAASAQAETNSVVQYLTGAKRQYQTEAQRQEIIRGLDDMLTRSPDSLREQRYEDFVGDRVWPLTLMLAHFVVPARPMDIDDQAFYEDAGKIEARHAIQEQLTAIRAEAP